MIVKHVSIQKHTIVPPMLCIWELVMWVQYFNIYVRWLVQYLEYVKGWSETRFDVWASVEYNKRTYEPVTFENLNNPVNTVDRININLMYCYLICNDVQWLKLEAYVSIEH
jgi:hypothetical protein